MSEAPNATWHPSVEIHTDVAPGTLPTRDDGAVVRWGGGAG